MHVMDCPILYYHLNLQENTSGTISRIVYANGKQFRSMAELKAAIIEGWDNIDATFFQRLEKMYATSYILCRKHGACIGY